MEVEENEDAYLTFVDYSSPYPIDIDNNIDESQNSTHLLDDENLGKSDYHSIGDLNSLLSKKGEGDLFALHMNAVSLVSHFDEIDSLINAKTSISPDILCISETRLKDEKMGFQSDFVSLPEFNLLCDNSKTSAGGVAIYIKNTFRFSAKYEFKLDVPDCESLFIELDLMDDVTLGNTKSILIGCVYRHPRPNTMDFSEKLTNVIELYSTKNAPVLILGDININCSRN